MAKARLVKALGQLHKLTSLADLEPMTDRQLLDCFLSREDETARELGWPTGSMSRRLARARELLRGRLVRRGVTLSVPALEALLRVDQLSAAVPLPLTAATVRAGLLAAAGAATPAGAVAGLVTG